MLTEAIGEALGVRPDRILSPVRGTARVALARQVAIYLARTRLGLSFTEAGRLFRRDRTTAAHACRRIEESRDDAHFDALIDRLDVAIAGRLATRDISR
ncbi:DNA replication initiation ATPase [Kaistia geumhonensis]|uniref:Chromosomal replication initiation ATPase DnaA n=1 Tax=Kaistia geumhonensis TaxID=410839 RepID=A0ABU0M3R2_9HYPH|nr:helix-turn-helix domain-containing protein [Kaistia geumhonensis]MCX5479188.1 DNA replication initiation ATPase [Kaistia geumhonensis]MDQ0515592.1 chromosomal replication initiation ATPase DnaA [Kaistia geumhonensis]